MSSALGLVSHDCCMISVNALHLWRTDKPITLLPKYHVVCLMSRYILGMDGYPTRLSGSGRISTIRRNPTPVGLYVTRRIGLAPIIASTSVRQSAVAAIWFAACVEWLANYSNRPSRQVRPLIGLQVPGDKHLMFVSCKLSPNRQFIRRPA